MAATILGTAHLYGIEGTVSNATVLKFDEKGSAKNMATTENEDGNEIEWRLDDDQYEASMTVRMRTSYTIPAIGALLAYNSNTYAVFDTSKSTQNKGFREVTLNLKRSEYITLTI